MVFCNYLYITCFSHRLPRSNNPRPGFYPNQIQPEPEPEPEPKLEPKERECVPKLSFNPAYVLDEVGKTAQKFKEQSIALNIDLERRLNQELRDKNNRREKQTRQRLLFGDPNKIICIADELLEKNNGEVIHINSIVDPKGKLLMYMVIKHEVNDEKKD